MQTLDLSSGGRLFEFLKGNTTVKPGQIGLAYEGNEMAMV
jgi:hypothetical protein